MKTRIHVNQHNIRNNQKYSGEPNRWLPVFTVKTYKENIKCNHLEVLGKSTLWYDPVHPLPCGAKAWIETEAEVVIHE